MRTSLWLLALVACGNEGGSPAPVDSPLCPIEKPDEATSCTSPTPTAEGCTYLIETCACGPDDIAWSCRCVGGGWECTRGYDCYPCPDAAI